jgi:ABC-type transporter MlaC component
MIDHIGANDDGSITVKSLITRSNGDVVRLDWRVADAGGLKISDLIVAGISLRTKRLMRNGLLVGAPGFEPGAS